MLNIITLDTILNGSLNVSGWGIVGVGLILTHITIASVTIYLHRHQAHKALDLHPVASHFFRFWLQNRFPVMALYGRRVILPALRLESKRADAATRRLLREVKPQLMRDPVLINEGARLVLSRVLATNSTLATVYQFKAQLRELWSNARLSHESRLEALHEWCRRAEATSIESLKVFADGLRGYSMVQ